MEAQVEPPGDVPRAMSGSSFYRVGSDSTLEELQKQMDKQAMATGSMPAAERLDRIAPDPCEGSCPLPMPKAGTGAESIPLEVIEHKPPMRILHSALDTTLYWGGRFRMQRAIMRCLPATTSAVCLVSIGSVSSLSCPLVWSYTADLGG